MRRLGIVAVGLVRRMAMMFLACCLTAACSGAASPTTPTAVTGEPGPLPFGAEIQQVLVDGLKASNGAGVSAAVIVPGYEPWVGVAGYSAVEPSRLVPMRPDMLFQIGSVGKNFTATLMLQLVEEGRLSLDDPISRWVSGYEQIDPAITVRQILNHTSGIYDWEDNPRSVTGLFASEGYPAIDWGHSWTLDDVMALVEEPDFPPGESWHYSNTGYYLARVIIEAETGMPISEALRTRLLDPLGLDDTWVECDQPAPEGVEFAHAWVDVNGDTNFDDISAQPNTLYCTILSSPIWTTAEDLARWSQALFHEGRVLSQGSLDEMLTFVPATTDPTEPMVREYGLGVGKFNFGVIATGDAAYLEHLDHYGHGGDVIGYNALMIYLPQHHATVVALFNENATINTTAGPLLEVVDRNLSEGKENGAFDTASGWTLVAGLVGIVVVVSSIAFVWRARAGGRRGEGASALAGLVALGLILVALGIEDRLVGYSLIGAGVVIAVLAAIFRSRLGGR